MAEPDLTDAEKIALRAMLADDQAQRDARAAVLAKQDAIRAAQDAVDARQVEIRAEAAQLFPATHDPKASDEDKAKEAAAFAAYVATADAEVSALRDVVAATAAQDLVAFEPAVPVKA